MDYQKPNLREALASEYVLGTMRGASRRRFERLVKQYPEYAEAVAFWEDKLGDFSARVRSIQPHPKVWKSLSAFVKREKHGTEGVPWQWRPAALFGAVASLILAVALFMFYGGDTVEDPVFTPDARGIVASIDSGKPAWIAQCDMKNGLLELQRVAATPIAADKSFHLWLVMKEGGVQSAGLLDMERVRLRIPALWMRDAKALAVSLEPHGGSSTGEPTGPVLFQGSLSMMSAPNDPSKKINSEAI